MSPLAGDDGGVCCGGCVGDEVAETLISAMRAAAANGKRIKRSVSLCACLMLPVNSHQTTVQRRRGRRGLGCVRMSYTPLGVEIRRRAALRGAARGATRRISAGAECDAGNYSKRPRAALLSPPPPPRSPATSPPPPPLRLCSCHLAGVGGVEGLGCGGCKQATNITFRGHPAGRDVSGRREATRESSSQSLFTFRAPAPKSERGGCFERKRAPGNALFPFIKKSRAGTAAGRREAVIGIVRAVACDAIKENSTAREWTPANFNEVF
ncbi:Protein of unknown function [Gryllus bimaculatus]|nr:Protein of unknown function [Gryllus bimaculatus]